MGLLWEPVELCEILKRKLFTFLRKIEKCLQSPWKIASAPENGDLTVGAETDWGVGGGGWKRMTALVWMRIILMTSSLNLVLLLS